MNFRCVIIQFNIDFNKELVEYQPFEDAKGYEGPILILRGAENPLVEGLYNFAVDKMKCVHI